MITKREISDTIVAAAGSPWLCKDGQCGECALSTLAIKQSLNETYTDFLTGKLFPFQIQ